MKNNEVITDQVLTKSIFPLNTKFRNTATLTEHTKKAPNLYIN